MEEHQQSNWKLPLDCDGWNTAKKDLENVTSSTAYLWYFRHVGRMYYDVDKDAKPVLSLVRKACLINPQRNRSLSPVNTPNSRTRSSYKIIRPEPLTFIEGAERITQAPVVLVVIKLLPWLTYRIGYWSPSNSLSLYLRVLLSFCFEERGNPYIDCLVYVLALWSNLQSNLF